MSSGITFSGLGSGLDTEQIVQQLMSIESRTLARLESRKSSKQQALTIYGDLRSKLSELESLASQMNTIREFHKMSATSGDEDIFTVDVESTASAGNHTIKVNTLAQAEMEVSQGYAAITDAVGTGTVSITLGTGDPVEITIDSAHNSLSGLMDAINSSDADVTASIMNDGDASNPYRLVVTSNETGTANAIEIDVTGLSGGTTPIFTDGAGGTPGQQAVDATMTFDGVDVTKSSNEVDDLLTGVTINLLEVDTENTYNLTIESNLEGIKESIGEFVTKYNEVYDYLKDKSSTDAVDGDYTFSSIKRQLQSIVTGQVEGVSGIYSTMSQIGITTDSKGHLTIDDEDLENALEENFDDVMQIFTAYGNAENPNITFHTVGSNTVAGEYEIIITGIGEDFGATINGVEANVSESGNLIYGAVGTDAAGLMIEFTGTTAGNYGNVSVSVGIFEKLESLLDNMTSTTGGVIKIKEDSINSSIDYLQMEIEREEESLDKIEARLKAQFTKMETTLSQLQTQGSFLGSL